MQKHARAGDSVGPLTGASLAERLPPWTYHRARDFYSDRLGLEPVDERDGGLLYTCGGQEFALFASAGRASGEGTQLGPLVPYLDLAVAELRSRGLQFETFDFWRPPGHRRDRRNPRLLSVQGPDRGAGDLVPRQRGHLLSLGEYTYG